MTRDDILLIAKRMIEERGGSRIDDEAELLRFAVVLGNRVAAAEREACVNIIETHQIPVGNSAAGELACEWTYDALHQIRDEIRARGEKK